MRDESGVGQEAAVALGNNGMTPTKALGIVRQGGVWTITGIQCQDRAWLKEHCIKPWQELEAKGLGIVVGEWGPFSKTPHDVVLRWMEDNLANWKEAGWGWMLWEFRGNFGVLDSKREDVQYEDFKGMKLDRKMWDLLRR